VNRAKVDIAVGLFGIAAFAILMWGTMQIGAFPGLFQPEARLLTARFDNAAGLDPETNVLVAGVPVGKVAAVGLDGRSARVSIRIEDPELRIPMDSVVAIRSRGMLGERVLELIPGSSGESLPSGGVITRTRSAPSVDELVDGISAMTEDVHQVTTSFSNVLGGAEGEEAVREVLSNVRVLSGRLRRIVEENEERIDRIAINLDAFAIDVRELTVDNRDQIGEVLTNLWQASHRLNSSLERFDAIATKIDAGEGSLGKLLTDDNVYNEIDAAIVEARAALREVRRAAAEAQEQIPSTLLMSIFGSLF